MALPAFNITMLCMVAGYPLALPTCSPSRRTSQLFCGAMASPKSHRSRKTGRVPANYHDDMTGVRRSFRADMVQKRKTSSAIVNQTPSLSSVIPIPTMSLSASDFEVEIPSSPHLSPTNSCIPRHKRIMNHSPSNDRHAKRSQFISPLVDSPSLDWPSVAFVPLSMGH